MHVSPWPEGSRILPASPNVSARPLFPGRTLLRGRDQPDDLPHARAVEVLAGIHAAGDFEFSERVLVLIQSHQTGGKRIVILGAGLKPHSLAKLFFRLRQLFGINQRHSEIMVAE